MIVRALGDLRDAGAVPQLSKLLEQDGPLARVAHESSNQLSGKTPSLAFDEKPSDRSALVLFWKGWWQEYSAAIR